MWTFLTDGYQSFRITLMTQTKPNAVFKLNEKKNPIYAKKVILIALNIHAQ